MPFFSGFLCCHIFKHTQPPNLYCAYYSRLNELYQPCKYAFSLCNTRDPYYCIKTVKKSSRDFSLPPLSAYAKMISSSTISNAHALMLFILPVRSKAFPRIIISYAKTPILYSLVSAGYLQAMYQRTANFVPPYTVEFS